MRQIKVSPRNQLHSEHQTLRVKKSHLGKVSNHQVKPLVAENIPLQKPVSNND